MNFKGYTRKEITESEYSSTWKLSLGVCASVSDPNGTISPMSTPGEYRMVTVWGEDPETPVVECNTRGDETKYYRYEKANQPEGTNENT